MNIDDCGSLQENQGVAAAENGHGEENGATVVDDGLSGVTGGSGYTFLDNCFNCGTPLRGHVKKCPKCGFELKRFG